MMMMMMMEIKIYMMMMHSTSVTNDLLTHHRLYYYRLARLYGCLSGESRVSKDSTINIITIISSIDIIIMPQSCIITA